MLLEIVFITYPKWKKSEIYLQHIQSYNAIDFFSDMMILIFKN